MKEIDNLSKQQSLSMAYINLSAYCPYDQEDDDRDARKASLMLMGGDRLEHELGKYELRNKPKGVDEAIYNCRRSLSQRD